ncbi:MAG: M23 family metallopeptidase [Deltaproteobacteria bacterium]|nr:M23 family metallopeptidase [Deltaproteobacteria bacterium]
MASKKTTILFLPRGLHKVRKITISRGAMFTLLFFIFIILLSVSWFTTDYIKIKTKIPELQYLKKENRVQKTQIIALTKKINHINQNMVKLQKFERKLRVMTNLEPSKQHDQLLAVGGSNASTLTSGYQPEEVHKGLIQQMHKSLEDLETKTAIASISQSQLNDFLKEQKSILACTPSIRPTDGWFSSGFGYRISPFTNQREFHKGIDIATRIGTPVIASADGLVVHARKEGNFGKMIAINHGYNLKTRYGHLSKFQIKKGQHVKRGQIIGEVGNTGRCTGPHLHYEVLLNGVPVNPLRFILN